MSKVSEFIHESTRENIYKKKNSMHIGKRMYTHAATRTEIKNWK